MKGYNDTKEAAKKPSSSESPESEESPAKLSYLWGGGVTVHITASFIGNKVLILAAILLILVALLGLLTHPTHVRIWFVRIAVIKVVVAAATHLLQGKWSGL
ncbi:hypothetical protein E2C01_020226 [Portunus trituberculatus]|uniref:Uncharacterized protein n=1 Tax=Portunus trituberculatus TaxID=210409 RepID=A0A5B7DZD2_PORTR|nr:hypothetical protein [Portunus trituberculatus]